MAASTPRRESASSGLWSLASHLVRSTPTLLRALLTPHASMDSDGIDSLDGSASRPVVSPLPSLSPSRALPASSASRFSGGRTPRSSLKYKASSRKTSARVAWPQHVVTREMEVSRYIRPPPDSLQVQPQPQTEVEPEPQTDTVQVEPQPPVEVEPEPEAVQVEPAVQVATLGGVKRSREEEEDAVQVEKRARLEPAAVSTPTAVHEPVVHSTSTVDILLRLRPFLRRARSHGSSCRLEGRRIKDSAFRAVNLNRRRLEPPTTSSLKLSDLISAVRVPPPAPVQVVTRTAASLTSSSTGATPLSVKFKGSGSAAQPQPYLRRKSLNLNRTALYAGAGLEPQPVTSQVQALDGVSVPVADAVQVAARIVGLLQTMTAPVQVPSATAPPVAAPAPPPVAAALAPPPPVAAPLPSPPVTALPLPPAATTATTPAPIVTAAATTASAAAASRPALAPVSDGMNSGLMRMLAAGDLEMDLYNATTACSGLLVHAVYGAEYIPPPEF